MCGRGCARVAAAAAVAAVVAVAAAAEVAVAAAAEVVAGRGGGGGGGRSGGGRGGSPMAAAWSRWQRAAAAAAVAAAAVAVAAITVARRQLALGSGIIGIMAVCRLVGAPLWSGVPCVARRVTAALSCAGGPLAARRTGRAGGLGRGRSGPAAFFTTAAAPVLPLRASPRNAPVMQ